MIFSATGTPDGCVFVCARALGFFLPFCLPATSAAASNLARNAWRWRALDMKSVKSRLGVVGTTGRGASELYADLLSNTHIVTPRKTGVQ